MTEVNDSQWYESETPPPATQLKNEEIEALCQAIIAQRKVCEDIKEKAKVENSKLEKLNFQMVTLIRELGRKNWPSQHGLFMVRRKQSWALPKSDADRAAFFNFLKQEGTFESLITVNHNTFNSYVSEKFERAESEGRSVEFTIPGVGEPSVVDTLAVGKGK